MKRIASLALVVSFCMNLAACATFKPFNNSHVRSFRRELLRISCVEEFEMKIGYGDALVVNCSLREDTDYELANEVYQQLVYFVCSEPVMDEYFEAIDEIWGRISFSFIVGNEPGTKHFNYSHSVYKAAESDGDGSDFYDAYSSWPEEYSSLPEF